MNDGGYIKLHRQIMNWEWFQNPNTFRVFVYLLLTANYADGRFEGKPVKRGQLVTSLPKISTGSRLSIQQVRTALKHLKSTGEITDDQQAGYRVITIVKYDQYQADNRQSNRQSTGDQQAANRQSTGELTGNQQQYKNNKNNTRKKDIKEEQEYSLAHADDDFDFFWETYPRKIAKQDAQKAWKSISPDPELLEKIIDGLRRWIASDQWQKDDGRFIPYPATWLRGRRWEDEVRQQAPSAPTRRTVIAQDFEQRDYSSVPDEEMRRMAERIARMKAEGRIGNHG